MLTPELETLLQNTNAKDDRCKLKMLRALWRRIPEVTNGEGAERPLSNLERNWAAWEKWRGSAERFTGLDARLRAKHALRHIRLTESGYQVLIIRGGKKVFSRYFVGYSQESLEAAMRVRDEALREVPPRRSNPIPPEVLRALGLSSPVAGIARQPQRSAYRVQYETPEGKRRVHAFYYRRVSEADAYAAAIAFLQERLRQKEEAQRQKL